VTSVTTTLHETNSSGADLASPNTGTSITIDAGGYVTDYATVTPSTATGSVAFRYYTSQTVCQGDSTQSAGTSAGSGTVSGGSAHSTTTQFSSPGTYYWRAFFSGTGLNLNSSSDCSETLVVNQYQPTLGTGQTVKITDSVTISVTGGGALSGTAHFQPFSDSSCTAGNELATQENVSVSGASPQIKSATTMVTFNTTGAHAVYWKVSYTSNNPAQKDIAASCTEGTTLTITNTDGS
jgi:hypothetical protein